jgi:GrpB-like predicted nucleotidyltransferase (UPF0157 family)
MIVIEPYKESWPATFRDVGAAIRTALGEVALAIHHIGSTSVPGLAAKDIIDVQLSVADLEVPIRAPLEAIGFVYRSNINRDHAPPGMDIDPGQLEKRYFKGVSPDVHLHIRVPGRFNQSYPLLCRDYLRTHPLAVRAYEEVKCQLAARFSDDADAYYAIKDPVFDVLMAGAHEWAEWTSWQLPVSDS